MIPLYSNSINWTNIPIPNHKGILLSSEVSKAYSVQELKDKLMKINLENGFEEILENVYMKLIELIEFDTLWLIKWKKNNRIFLALSFGSEL